MSRWTGNRLRGGAGSVQAELDDAAPGPPIQQPGHMEAPPGNGPGWMGTVCPSISSLCLHYMDPPLVTQGSCH